MRNWEFQNLRYSIFLLETSTIFKKFKICDDILRYTSTQRFYDIFYNFKGEGGGIHRYSIVFWWIDSGAAQRTEVEL